MRPITTRQLEEQEDHKPQPPPPSSAPEIIGTLGKFQLFFFFSFLLRRLLTFAFARIRSHGRGVLTGLTREKHICAERISNLQSGPHRRVLALETKWHWSVLAFIFAFSPILIGTSFVTSCANIRMANSRRYPRTGGRLQKMQLKYV